jgi:hypothetical protein
MGGVACNGWRFCGVADSAKAPAAKAARKPAKRRTNKGLFERPPDQEGLPEGMARYFCSACMDGFIAPADEEPSECPQDHKDGPAAGDA